MTNAERQRRYCERPYRRTPEGPPAAAEAVGRRRRPATAELLEGVCGVDPRQSSYREASAAAERSWRTTPHAGIMENLS